MVNSLKIALVTSIAFAGFAASTPAFAKNDCNTCLEPTIVAPKAKPASAPKAKPVAVKKKSGTRIVYRDRVQTQIVKGPVETQTVYVQTAAPLQFLALSQPAPVDFIDGQAPAMNFALLQQPTIVDNSYIGGFSETNLISFVGAPTNPGPTIGGGTQPPATGGQVGGDTQPGSGGNGSGIPAPFPTNGGNGGGNIPNPFSSNGSGGYSTSGGAPDGNTGQFQFVGAQNSSVGNGYNSGDLPAGFRYDGGQNVVSDVNFGGGTAYSQSGSLIQNGYATGGYQGYGSNVIVDGNTGQVSGNGVNYSQTQSGGLPAGFQNAGNGTVTTTTTIDFGGGTQPNN